MPDVSTTNLKPLASDQKPILKRLSLDDNQSKMNFFKKNKKTLIVAISILLSLIVFTGIYVFRIVQKLSSQTNEAKITAQATYTNFKNQNLPATEIELKKLQAQEQKIRQTYHQLAFFKYVPFAHNYYQDGSHAFAAAEAGLRAGLKSIEAISPYADVLGFAGDATFTGGTAEDRLKLVLQTLDKISPILDEISQELSTVEQELASIDAKRYPEKIKNQAIRSKLIQIQAFSKGAKKTVTQYRPILEQLPDIMGAKGPRKKYLILFQNDNELRPTGGFMTAYAIVFIEDGKVTPEKSDDIYELDKKFNQKITIPEELGRYLTTEKYWHLRDMNIAPDFKLSMEQFLPHYLNVRGEPTDIDGVIAVDTKLLTSLLDVLGYIDVPGYGTFGSQLDERCDCPQVVYVLSEIITRPTPYLREDRKGILGPMMRALLTQAYGAPKEQWPQLFQIGIENINARHIQLYFMDDKIQAAAEAINAAGRMNPVENADFLAIVNANLGGAKSNLFTNYEVEQKVNSPQDGKLTKTVEITYKNTRKADNCNLEAGKLCLNSTLRDWTRLYLPAGSQLIEAQGFTQEAKEYDENGFHVIDGFFSLEPLGQAKLKLTYTVPYTDEEIYRVRLWKQGGVDPIKTIMDVTGGQEEVVVNKDTLYETPF